jgi:hypothetical protein
MLNDHHSRTRQAKSVGYLLREVVKSPPRRQQHGGDAPIFQLYEVVDTPRRARSSIGATRKDQIDFASKLVDHLGLGRSGGVFGEDKSRMGSRPLRQLVRDAHHNQTCIRLAIVKNADARTS